FGFGIEQAPDRDHGVYVFFVQGIEILRYVVIVGIEDWVALGLPPEPVLHYCIEWDMLLSIALRDPANLVERYIAVFRLKESVRPLRQHGRVAGHGAVLTENAVNLRAVEEVIIDRLAGDGSQLQIEREAIVEVGERRRVPQQPVALASSQHDHRAMGVVLTQLYCRSSIVEHATLMLTQSVESLCNRWRKAVCDAVGVIAIELDRLIGARYAVAFVQQRFSAGCPESEIAALDMDGDLKLCGLQGGHSRVLCEGERRSGAGLQCVEHPRARRGGSRRFGCRDNMNHRVSTHGDLKDFVARSRADAMASLLDSRRRRTRRLLAGHLRGNADSS